ncbi:sulfatase [candidate division KSB1 bacterium]|nr:sulfatase [candidate division KSB1 bacterium]
MNRSDKQVTRRSFLQTAGAAAAAVPLLAGDSKLYKLQKIKGAKPRNVIFILSDDHRYDAMGFLGKPKFLETPHMDRMAREGAYLKYAFVTTSLCSPSRASILTGQYSHRHGVVDNQSSVPEGTVYFPQYLQQTGVQTAFFGKWHMGDNEDNPRPGFDKWVSFKGQGEYHDPTLNIDGKREKVQGYISDLLTDYALDWLENDRDQNKPYFLYLSHKAVHAMFQPAKRHLGTYEDVEVEYPESMANTDENYEGKPDWVRAQRNSWHGVDYMYHGAMDFDTFYKRYCETVRGIDDSVGRILQYLEEKGEAENTVVFYMGDNGFCFGEHGLIDKRHMYESSQRVPFLAWAPGLIQPGTLIQDMVQNIDVAPTVLELAGLTMPANMDGHSMLPLLQKKEVEWRDAVFYEYYWEWNFPHTPTVHGIRTDRYKYIHYHGVWDSDELYDLGKDPDERHNLIQSPDHKDIIISLSDRLWEWLEQTEGMKIPLRRARGFRADQRDPEK